MKKPDRPRRIVADRRYADTPASQPTSGGGSGLRLRSQVMVDKAATIPRAKAESQIGRLDEATLASVSRALAGFLGLG